MNNRKYDIKLILETDINRYEIIGEVLAYRELYGDDADGNRGEWRNCIETGEIKSIKNEDEGIELIERIRSRDKFKIRETLNKIHNWFDDNIDASHVADQDEAEADRQADQESDRRREEGRA